MLMFLPPVLIAPEGAARDAKAILDQALLSAGWAEGKAASSFEVDGRQGDEQGPDLGIPLGCDHGQSEPFKVTSAVASPETLAARRQVHWTATRIAAATHVSYR